jgi:hypothetical protein
MIMAVSRFLKQMSSTCCHESYRATLKKEAVKSTETLVCMDQASQHHNPKDSSHNFHLCKERKYQACYFEIPYVILRRTAVARWLRCCAINRKVSDSIPAGFSGFFIDIKCLGSHYGPGVDSASNRNENQEHFLGVKAAGA